MEQLNVLNRKTIFVPGLDMYFPGVKRVGGSASRQKQIHSSINSSSSSSSSRSSFSSSSSRSSFRSSSSRKRRSLQMDLHLNKKQTSTF